jgi:glutaredoxin
MSMSTNSRTRIYLKKICPYCLKLRIFLTEAGLADKFDFTVFSDGDDTHKALRKRMEAAGQEPGFPAAEIEPGKLTTGSDDLIARFAHDAGVDAAKLPLLKYYSEGVFIRHVEMFRELRQLKGA